MKKIGSDQAALRLVQYGMRLQRLFHLCGARLEDLEQVPVTAFEVLEHFGELPRGSPRLEPKNPADDMVGPGLIGRVEVSGLSRRSEGSDDDPGRIRAQMQDLAVQELGLRQGGSLGSFAVRSSDLRALRTNLDAGLVRSIIAVRLNSRISTRPRRYDSADSAPLFSLGRSGCSPSEQLPVSGSISVVCRSFSPRNQSNARIAPAGHSAPPSARPAARQAEIVAAASTGC